MRRLSAALLAAVLSSALYGADQAADIHAQWQRTLLYGMDSQVLELVGRLKDARDSTFTVDLLSVLTRTPNADLRKAVLDLFAAQKVRDAEETAKGILAGWDGEKPDVVSAAVQYLTAIESAGLAPALLPLVKGTDTSLAATALDAVGKSRDASAAKPLLDMLADPDLPAARKPAVILALGDLKDPSAVETLMGIVKNTDEDRTRRMYAADALGKIGDSRALPVLRGLLGDADPLARSYAASALASFDVSIVLTDLFQGLRDENWRVRVQCAKALGRRLPDAKVRDAADILAYKAELDPVSQVRLQAIRSLAEIGGDRSLEFLLGLYANPRAPQESRETALSVLADKTLTDSMVEKVRTVLADSAAAKDSRTLLSTGRILSTARSGAVRPLVAAWLDSSDPYMRIYAARAAAVNGFGDLKAKLLQLAEKDPSPPVQREAKAAAEKL
jgi:HEAT repeat protein